MRIAILVALSACGRISFEDVDAMPDAMPCVAPLSDNDDDGDGVADSCDNCPHIAGSQFDNDGDGVGDVCDPFSSTPTESVVRFEPFLSPLAWDTSNASQFSVGNSALVTTTVGSSAWAGYVADPPNTEAVMRGTIDAIGGGPKQLSIQFAIQAGEGSEYCEVYDEPATSFKITRGVPPDTFVTLAGTVIPALAPGPFAMSFGHSASGFHCSVTTGGATYEISTPETFSVPRDFIVLQFIELDATVESFAQIDTTP